MHEDLLNHMNEVLPILNHLVYHDCCQILERTCVALEKKKKKKKKEVLIMKVI